MECFEYKLKFGMIIILDIYKNLKLDRDMFY